MISHLIRWSLANRAAVLSLALLLCAVGAYFAFTMPVDVFPDLSAPTVTVLTEAHGMAPSEVESQITFPIETALNGASRVRRVRSSSAVGLSIVWVEFEWGSDIHAARQVVNEKLALAVGGLPPEVGRPILAPVSSIMGEIMFISVTSPRLDPMELRTAADTVIRRRLLSVPGVSQITAIGGDKKQYQVVLQASRMSAHGISMKQVSDALAASNENLSAGFLDEGGSEYLVTGVGRFRSYEDIREVVVSVAGGVVTLALTVHNRGRDAVTPLNQRAVEPGTSRTDSLKTSISMKAGVWWLRWPRAGAMFTHPGSMVSEADVGRSDIGLTVFPSGTPNYAIGEPLPFNLNVPIQHREVDPVGGEIRRGVLVAEPVTVTLDRRIQYAPANTSLERDVVVRVQSHDLRPRDVRVNLELPRGLTLDSAWRTVRLERSGSAASVRFRVRGRLTAGSHGLTAVAESEGRRFTAGYQTVEYDHIRRRRIELPSSATMSAVDVRLPPALRVAYVRGVGDNVAPMLEQLGIPVTMITPAELLSGEANLPAYSTVVIGSRAYESSPELAQANERLFDFARRGGTVVVQYGQNEMTRPGMLPYSINLGRPAPRVTEEDAPVAIIDPDARELRAPNRIGPGDFTGWVQERGLYMPRTFDERWRPLLEMNDTGEQPIRGGILVAPVGEGVYVYTTLSFFRQLPAGVPGAARLFVNLLSAGAAPAGSQP